MEIIIIIMILFAILCFSFAIYLFITNGDTVKGDFSSMTKSYSVKDEWNRRNDVLVRARIMQSKLSDNMETYKKRKDYKAIELIYNNIIICYNNYGSQLLSTPILPKKPLDPFVAGGIADGLVGGAAGFYVGVNQLAKQQEYKNMLEKFNSSLYGIDRTIAELEHWCNKASQYIQMVNNE